MQISRREACKWLGLSSALFSSAPLLAASERQLKNIGLQLYTVRDQMAQDVERTLAAVAKAGYSEVETAGTGNLSADQFATALGKYGLSAPAAHIPITAIEQQPEQVLQNAQTIGYRYLVVPWLPQELRNHDGYARTAQTMNRFGHQCAAQGIQLAYHNHDFEFEQLGEQTAFDFLLTNCDRDLVKFELDLFWAAHAGVDAAQILSDDPQRFPMCHVKDRNAAGEMVDVGAGEIDFAGLFKAGTGLQHYFVEHDRPANSLASIKASIAALRTVRY